MKVFRLTVESKGELPFKLIVESSDEWSACEETIENALDIGLTDVSILSVKELK